MRYSTLFPLTVIITLLLCTSIHAQNSSSSSSSSTATVSLGLYYGSINFTRSSTVSTFLPARSQSACTNDLHHRKSSTSRLFVLGGQTPGGAILSDIWSSADGSNTWEKTDDTQSGAPAPNRQGGKAAYLLDNSLLWFGGEEGTQSNDVWVSGNSGSGWVELEQYAPWSARQEFSVAVIPTTNIVILCCGYTTTVGYNASDVWISQDGVGSTWSLQSNSTPFATVRGASLVGMYDYSLVLTGGSLPVTVNGSVVQQATNNVYASFDVGRTWQSLGTGQFSPRVYHSTTVDADDYLYLSGGAPSATTNAALDVYVSNSHGASWYLLQVSFTVGTATIYSQLYSCMAVYYPTPTTPTLIIFTGNDGNLNVTAAAYSGAINFTLAPVSSTAVNIPASDTQTVPPTLPTAASYFTAVSANAATGSSSTATTTLFPSSATSVGTSTGNGQAPSHSVCSWVALLACSLLAILLL